MQPDKRPANKQPSTANKPADNIPPTPDQTIAKTDAPSNPLAWLIFDPLRLIPTLIRRSWLILLAGIIGAGIGAGIGILKTETMFTVNLRLVKKEISTAFRAGRLGEAYAPPKLRPATLISAVGSYSALKRVSDRSGIPVATLRSSFELKEERKTDLMLLTVWTSKGRKEAAELANIWGEEIVNYTRDLQANESRDVRAYLEEQTRNTDQQIAKLERDILQQIQRNGTVDPEKEIEAYLQSLNGLELDYHNARIELESTEAKIIALSNALRRQSPSVERLRELQKNYELLLSQYTRENPLVIEAADNIRQLKEQIQNEQKSDEIGEDTFTGTGISDSLYLELVEMRNRQELLKHRTDELEKLLVSNRERVRKIPEQAMLYMQLTEQKKSLLGARELLFSRLQEALLFENKAPGYLSMLAPATAEEVQRSSQVFKTVLAAGIFGSGLAGLAFLAIAGMEIASPRLKSKQEMEYVFRQPACGIIPPGGPNALSESERPLVWSALTSGKESSASIAVWIPFQSPDEEALWKWFLQESERLFERIAVVDAGDPPLASLSHLPEFNLVNRPPSGRSACQIDTNSLSMPTSRSLAAGLNQQSSQESRIYLRLTGGLEEPKSALLTSSETLIILADPHAASRSEWKQAARWLSEASALSINLLVINTQAGVRLL